MQVADSRMIASVGFWIFGSVALLDPDVAGGVHHDATHVSSPSYHGWSDGQRVASLRQPALRDAEGVPVERCTDRASQPRPRVVPSKTWTTEPRSASS